MEQSLQANTMEESLRAIADVSNTLFNKDIELNEQKRLTGHQAKLLAEQHAEIAALKKKIDELRGFAATLQGRVYDQGAELAALKFKSVEFAGTQTDLAVSQEMQVQTDAVTVSTREIETQTVTGYVAYAMDKTDEFLVKAHEARFALRREINEVQAELADWEATTDEVELVLHELNSCQSEVGLLGLQVAKLMFLAPEPLVQALEVEALDIPSMLSVEPVINAEPFSESEPAKKASKKKRSAPKKKLDEEEKAARMEAELKAHEEAVRARKEEERRKEAQKKAERKARMQNSRAQKEQDTEVAQTRQPAAARAPPPCVSVLNPAQIDMFGKFQNVVFETFAMRSEHKVEEEIFGDTFALLRLFVLECFGADSWNLHQVGDKFKLVAVRKLSGAGRFAEFSSPLGSMADIVFWTEREEFVKLSHWMFKPTPLPTDELVASTVANAFLEIKDFWGFKVLGLRGVGGKDAFGLSMLQITTKNLGVLTVSRIKLVTWFRLGRIDSMAAQVNPRFLLDDFDLEFE